MRLITVTRENLEREHICCAISNNRDCQVMAKKRWMEERFADGLTFVKGDVRGKCFIEYIPAENAWAPIEADGYMYINCLWVSGQFKGQGHSTLLLDACVRDSRERDKAGLAILSATKKLPFLADPQFLRHKGFQAVDAAEPYYRLYCLPFDAAAEKPRFKAHVRSPRAQGQGFVLYYTHQCPFTAKYVPLIEGMARARGLDFAAIRLESARQAQDAPAPFTTYSLFYNGAFLTHEILSEKKFAALVERLEGV